MRLWHREVMRRREALRAAALMALATFAGGAGCASAEVGKGGAGRPIRLGFSQVGSESGWRVANSRSVTESAAAAGIALDFQDGRQEQQNQIDAIRRFVRNQVDVIAFSPIVESGWDTVLQAAKDAKVPVILTDRTIDSTDTSLYRTLLGSDFTAEGRKAGEWLVEEYRTAPEHVNIVEIEGTTGSAPANDRRQGFADAIKGNPRLTVVASKDGQFTKAGGQAVMTEFLRQQTGIDVVYAHNDEEGLGAIEAIQAAGKVPGADIKVVTVDATHDGMVALADGRISYIVECNPLLGPQLMALVKKVVAGQPIPNRVVTSETTFDQQRARTELPARQY
jgi:ABC-type sugar transport system substrate-binding protein